MLLSRFKPYRPATLGVATALLAGHLIGFKNPDGTFNFEVVAVAALFILFAYFAKDRDVTGGTSS